MIGVFADSFYFIALLNPDDRFHAEAVRFTGASIRDIVTTGWVLVEVADALCAPKHRRNVHQWLGFAASHPRIQVIPADAAWYARGLALYGARPDKGWSLTDCISFEVMNEFGLSEALTGDHHFEQAGFRALFREA